MASYTLSLEVPNVDEITGIEISFVGSIRSKDGTLHSFGETTKWLGSDGSYVFNTTGKGKILKGRLMFSSAGDPSTLSSEGQTYLFQDPGVYNVKIRSKKPSKQIVVPLSALTSGPVNLPAPAALLPSDQLNLMSGDSNLFGIL